MKETTANPIAAPTVSLHAFVQGATHEIANPLSSISMGAEVAKLMLERGQIDGARELIDRIIADCVRCAQLLQGLQRFGAGLHARPRETVAAREFAEAIVAMFRADHRGAALSMRVHADGDQFVHVDRATFEHACTDLLQNAFDAGADEVDITIRRSGESVIFAVGDNGSGLAKEAMAHALDPFFSTRRAAGKSGLGLTLLRELARLHGGDLSVAANAPAGAIVELYLPCAPTSAPDGLQQPGEESQLAGASPVQS
jgi:signal transduction histidine kinase